MKKQQSLGRVYFLISVMGVWGTVIGARLYFLQVVHSSDLRTRAEKQQQQALDISPRRGIIYDRNNKELAISIKVDSVFAVPGEITDRVQTSKVLSEITGIPKAELLGRFDTDKSFLWIKRKISAAEANAIRKAKLTGIYFQKEDQRFYPNRELAAHVLGYVNMDEDGIGGLEYKYNDIVRGEPGRVVVRADARRHRYDSTEQPTVPGANLVTTIDSHIQYIVEKEIKVAEEQTRAAGISVIAMDPRSGEILAMANYPQFNPNEYGKYPPSAWINRAVSQTYEPGSTFKILTVGSALEERLTTPDEMIDCLMGSIVLANHRIHDHKPYGLLSVQDIIKNSSDVGAIKLGLRLGPDRFYSYIQRMGFGRATSIDLPGEERGLTRPPSRWSGISIGSISMGQEIGVTPLQIISMVSAVANGGILYRPFVVKRIQHPTSGITETDPHGERVLSTETTADLRQMLEVVVTDGTAKSGKLEGYTAAGKTGTAQKIDATGHYSKTKYVASFAGFVPASNPMIAMIVVVDEAVGLHQGGQVAAPIFKRIAEQTMRYMSVPPDIPLYSPKYTQKEEKKKSEPAPPPKPPQWKVVDASFTPTASAPLADDPGDIAIPDFYGKSLRQVTEQCLKLGLRLRSIGSGAAAQQFPVPGVNARAGAYVQVRFTTKR
jgi:cell division protein FtsI (penicillin-binding protein 3)